MTATPLHGVRIAVDARYLARSGTGINEYLVGALRVLRAAGADLTLVSHIPVEPPDDLRDLPVRVLRILPRSGIVWDQLRIPPFLARGRYDWYFAPANVGLPLLPVGRTRLMQTVHDLVPLHEARTRIRQQPLLMLTYLPAIAISMLRATRIMADSAATAADVQRWFRRRPVVTLLPLVAMGVVGGPPPPVVEPREPVVVFNGGMDPRKNVAVLLRAFAVFRQERPSFRLILMGRHFESVRPLIDELGLVDAVELTGYVSQERKLALLAAASVVAYPSSFEGYGLPIVEAMACGTPVVCGRGGSQQEIGGDAAIFVDPVTPAALAEALERAAALHDDPDALAAYSVRAARRLASLSGAAIGDRIALLFAPDRGQDAGGAANHRAPATPANAAGDAGDPSVENASLSNRTTTFTVR